MARSFNGTTDKIDLGNPAVLDPASLSMTVGCWVNPAGTGPTRFVSRGLSSGLKGWALGIANAGADLQFTKYGVADVTSTIVLSTSAWVYVAAVVSSTQVHFVSYDTSGTKTTNDQSNSGALLTGANNALVGGESVNSGGLTKVLSGSLAEVSVWFGAELSDAQLLTAAFGGVTGIQAVLAMPLLGDSPEVDHSGSGLSGTVTGTLVVAHPPISPPKEPAKTEINFIYARRNR